jgi:hypothetical protein
MLTAAGLTLIIAEWRFNVLAKNFELNLNTADVALFAVTFVLG